MNRRKFTKLIGIGVFTILPGAGRIWKVQKQLPDLRLLYSPYACALPPMVDFIPIYFRRRDPNYPFFDNPSGSPLVLELDKYGLHQRLTSK